MLLRTNCKKIFHSLSLLVTNSPEYPTLRGGREPTSLVESARHPPGRPAVDPGRPLFFQSMIRKSGNRFSEKIMLQQKDEIMIRFNPIGS
jgi:hypothetical protein